MRAPAFWWDERPSAWARVLAPLGNIYGAVTARRMRRRGAKAAVPIICIGNFIAGGAGKTPVALALSALLRDMGEQPAFLSRGYGGNHKGGPHHVDPARDAASFVGDEPLLLATVAPTFVCADRVAGAAACAGAGASVVLLDDGLQNSSLQKNLAFAVVDGRTGVGNGLCMPAGPLRAALADQWPFVDALIVVGDGIPGVRLANDARSKGKLVFAASLEPDPTSAARLNGQRVFAFAGIGQPSKFFATLRGLGAQVVGTRAFADHHAFSAADILSVHAESARLAALPVTTEKDLVRIDARSGIEVLPVRLRFAEADALRSLIAARIAE